MSKYFPPPQLQFEPKSKLQYNNSSYRQRQSNMVNSSQTTFNNVNNKILSSSNNQSTDMSQTYFPYKSHRHPYQYNKYSEIKTGKLSDLEGQTSQNSIRKNSIDSQKDKFYKEHKQHIDGPTYMTCSNDQYNKKFLPKTDIKYHQDNQQENISIFIKQTNHTYQPRKNSMYDQNIAKPFIPKPHKYITYHSKQKIQSFNDPSKFDSINNVQDTAQYKNMQHQKKKSMEASLNSYQHVEKCRTKRQNFQHDQSSEWENNRQDVFRHTQNFLPKQKKHKNDSQSEKIILLNQKTIIKQCDSPPFQQIKFYVLKKLGEGSYGEVFLVIEQHTKSLFAIKVMSKQKIKQSKNQINIFRQLKIHSYLDHRNIIKLYLTFDDSENIYLLMQYSHGGSLFSVLKRQEEQQHLLCSQHTSSNIIRQLCEAVLSMHQINIIHRDLKLENIMFTNNFVKLGDFGCAVHSLDLRSTKIGSLAYHSPEQLKSNLYDEKVDVWSIGIILYELLVGETPFDEDIMKILNKQNNTLSQLKYPKNCKISNDAKDLISKFLIKNPYRRISLIEALKHPFITQNNKNQEVKF